jgi:hypothetical protein
MISGRKQKRLLLAAAFVLSTALFATAEGPFGPPPGPPPRNYRGCTSWNCKPTTVPDGGSTLVYVLGVGAACIGAIFARSRTAKQAA